MKEAEREKGRIVGKSGNNERDRREKGRNSRERKNND